MARFSNFSRDFNLGIYRQSVKQFCIFTTHGARKQRVTNTKYTYQANPIPEIDPIFSEFKGTEIKKVPVLRIYGTTPIGQKACLHIHGVFPYIYIPYSGQMKAEIMAYRLASALDTAINTSMGFAKSDTEHIYKIQQVSGIPFYGYHQKCHHFMKIYFYNPTIMKKAIELLQNGCILNQQFQPHEAHIPYTQQFMIDYNVYGMSFINLKSVKFRHENIVPGEINQLSDQSEDIFGSIESEPKEFLPNTILRQSSCQLEVDAWAVDILNRKSLDKGLDKNPGIQAIWEEEKERRIQENLEGGESQLTYPESPDRTQAAKLVTDNDKYQQNRLIHRLCTISQLGEESLLSSSNESSYAVEVPENIKLLDASRVEIHAGPNSSNTTHRMSVISPLKFHDDISILGPKSPTSADLTLNSSDYDLVNMLAKLADDNDDNEEANAVDDDSILGSQHTEGNNIDASSQENNDHEEEQDDIPDLNLTNLEISTFDVNSWDKFHNKETDPILQPFSPSSSDDIPQLDGPFDDEPPKLPPTSRNDTLDVTIERQESKICEYRRSTEKAHLVLTTPRKRRRVSTSSSEDDVQECSNTKNSTRRKLPTTPRSSPSKRLLKVTSPSCPSRYYSPLNVQVTGSPKSSKSPKKILKSPLTPPRVSKYDRNKSRQSFKLKSIFSRIIESSKESGIGLLEDSVLETTDIPKSSSSKQIIKPTHETVGNRQGTDSDCTLVEDSDDSGDKTMTESKMTKNFDIINESDETSNDSYLSTSSRVFGKKSSQISEISEDELNSLSFTEMIELRLQSINSQPNSGVLEENLNKKNIIIKPKFRPPSYEHIKSTLELYGIDEFHNAKPFFSKPEDITSNPQNQACLSIKVQGKSLSSFPYFSSCVDNITGIEKWRKLKVREFHFSAGTIDPTNLRIKLAGQETIVIKPLKSAPSRDSVIKWIATRKVFQKENLDKEERNFEMEKDIEVSQQSNKDSVDTTFVEPIVETLLSDLTHQNEPSKHLGISHGQLEDNTRKSINPENDNFGKAKALKTYQYITMLCIEVHITTRPGLLPDPRFDAITALFFAVQNDVPPDSVKSKPLSCGAIVVDESKCSEFNHDSGPSQYQSLTYVENEEKLLERIIKLVEDSDPEIILGYDIEVLSWGYIFQRAAHLKKPLGGRISRIPTSKFNWNSEDQFSDHENQSILGYVKDVRLPGRIVLDIWRLMKYELALYGYSYENVMYHLLNERIPSPNFDVLTDWWKSQLTRWRVVDHYSNKVIGVLRIIQHLDIINRTSEHARLFGVLFYEVFSRGSQFRVESMMLRLAKPSNYIPVSPSPHQRASMRAPESLPLIMEPESMIYTDPVVVLDFQSLYPSMIIAYNYCFSTCLGRIEHIGSPALFEFGATNLKITKKLALKLQNNINYSPCGVAFVKKEVREGILPRMLTEILETRLMVKKAMKDHSKEDKSLQRVLHSRQLGLKLIANVTYGYTAANFSGRMPCIEVGDSVVSKGKETLERAIKIVESTPRWKARVIYGDTDSLFVLLKGRSREEAFKIGAEIADTVTAANPKPVKLKFEKVLQPCILQTKKRYCGYIYENLNDDPAYFAKGIETVRRDGCPAVAKILEKSLTILFDTKDVSLLKEYVTRQLDKILTGRVSLQDLTFAREFRGLKGYKPTACVPALELTRRLMQKDPRNLPKNGERVPYIIVSGGPNEALIRCVCAPMELIQDPSLRPNATYYITKVIIPPLNRCLNLIGVDAYSWFMEMPHRQAGVRIQGPVAHAERRQQGTLSQYLQNVSCLACGKVCDKGICNECISNSSKTLTILYEKCRNLERTYFTITSLCQSCTKSPEGEFCTSLDCPIFYRRSKAKHEVGQVPNIYNIIESLEF